MSAVLQDRDETFDRALFERRARASGGQAGVPSLDAVLRAAQSDSGERSSGRRRAWGGLALAAACLLAVIKAHPGDVSRAGGSRPGIVADVSAQAATPGDRGAALCEDPQVSECSLDTTCSSVAATEPAVAQEDRVCTPPPQTFSSAATLSCDADDPVRTELR